MKNYFALIALFVFMIPGIKSQEEKSKFELHPGRMDRLILDVFHDNWLGDRDSVNVAWHSRGTSIGYLHDFQIKDSPFNAAAGLMFSSHNIHSKGRFVTVQDSMIYQPYSSGYLETVSINKLTTNYLDVPVEVRYRFKPRKSGNSWKIMLGIRAGYLINPHTKLVDDEGKYKDYNFPQFENTRYGAHFRVGYGPINVFGYYSVSQLFKENGGPKLHPFSVGVSFTPLF